MTAQLSLLSEAAEGERRKRKGLHRAERGSFDWMLGALTVLTYWTGAHPGTATADDLHRAVTQVWGEPKSPAIWGRLFQVAQERGLIRDTGETTRSTRAAARRRRVPIYEVGGRA